MEEDYKKFKEVTLNDLWTILLDDPKKSLNGHIYGLIATTCMFLIYLFTDKFILDKGSIQLLLLMLFCLLGVIFFYKKVKEEKVNRR